MYYFLYLEEIRAPGYINIFFCRNQLSTQIKKFFLASFSHTLRDFFWSSVVFTLSSVNVLLGWMFQFTFCLFLCFLHSLLIGSKIVFFSFLRGFALFHYCFLKMFDGFKSLRFCAVL